MVQENILDFLRQGLWVSFLAAAPVLAVALVTGVVIGLFQALTSIQEMTLTAVPKLAAILAVFWMTMGYSGQLLVSFFREQVITRIVSGM